MRNVSVDFRKALYDEDSGEVLVLLFTFIHPELPGGELRISTDNADLLNVEEQLRGTISRGKQYSFFPCRVSLPAEGEGVESAIQITFYDVGLEVSPVLERVHTTVFVTTEIVLAGSPDEVEVEYPVFELKNTDVQGDNIVLSLTVDGMAGEPYPADNFTPSGFPGLWSAF